jgi:hypothetical protein
VRTRHLVIAVALATTLLAGSVATSAAATAAGAGAQQNAQRPFYDPEYPFVCTVYQELGVQPEVDNQDGEGIPVIDETKVADWKTRFDGNYPDRAPKKADGTTNPRYVPDDLLAGWSRDCNLTTPIVTYQYYSRTSNNWVTFSNSGALPGDIAYVPANERNGFTVDGATPGTNTSNTPYIIRWERGVANRFLYAIAALAPAGEQPTDAINSSLWNGKLIYHFGGGVGIGRNQGRLDNNATRYKQELDRGYAVIYSSGTRTSTHYNLAVGGRTAVATKAVFEQRYGQPTYTVGVGGSGGGIQQYVYAQNHPGLLDGGVPQYAYPDMVTQTIHIGDCELLEHFFEKTDRANKRWATVENRIPVIGLNAESAPLNKAGSAAQWNGLYTMYQALGYTIPVRTNPAIPPLTECRAAWTGLTPSSMNPKFQTIGGMNRIEGYDLDKVEFTHWADAIEIYGVDDDGWARVPWSNIGVQYGLRAVANGTLTPAEFLRLNALVGSWKDSGDQVLEGEPFASALTGANTTAAILTLIGQASDPATREQARAAFDLWSSRNMQQSGDGVTPAPRRAADPIAIANAFDRGHVFKGDIDIPMIDWRHYLEEELDMHNTHQSFAVRQRMINAVGHYDNQLVWFTDGRPTKGFDQTPQALDVLDEWILVMQANPALSAGEAKAQVANATDACFRTDGSLLHRGDDVWDGILDDSLDTGLDASLDTGDCTAVFPTYTTSRIEAGGSITGDIFECENFITIQQAVAANFYGLWKPTAAQIARLAEIFPNGVCDNPAFYDEDPPLPRHTFADVAADRYFDEPVSWARVYGITTGWAGSSTEFRPAGTITRAQMAAFLWRNAGEPRPSGSQRFNDVPVGAYYDLAVRWLAEQDITGGFGAPGQYSPDALVTRAQMAAFLHRAAGLPVAQEQCDFSDEATIPSWARTGACWLKANGITTNNPYRPLDAVTRGEMATFLFRWFSLPRTVVIPCGGPTPAAC